VLRRRHLVARESCMLGKRRQAPVLLLLLILVAFPALQREDPFKHHV